MGATGTVNWISQIDKDKQVTIIPVLCNMIQYVDGALVAKGSIVAVLWPILAKYCAELHNSRHGHRTYICPRQIAFFFMYKLESFTFRCWHWSFTNILLYGVSTRYCRYSILNFFAIDVINIAIHKYLLMSSVLSKVVMTREPLRNKLVAIASFYAHN